MTPFIEPREVCGVPVEVIAKLCRRVCAEGNNVWKTEKVQGKTVSFRMRERFRCQADVYGKRLHLVEHGNQFSLRADGWALTFEHADSRNYRHTGTPAALMMPSGAGVQDVDGAKCYPARYSGYEISSAGKFKHDMTILLMFESEW